MKKPMGYTKHNLADFTRSELKIYLKVLQDKESWNTSLKYAVSIGDVVVSEEIEAVEQLLK